MSISGKCPACSGKLEKSVMPDEPKVVYATCKDCGSSFPVKWVEAFENFEKKFQQEVKYYNYREDH